MVHLADSQAEGAPPAYSAEATVHGPLSLSAVVGADEGGRHVLLTLTPPKEPVQLGDDKVGSRAPVDICCVIDVSGSMDTEAPVHDNETNQKEASGLSILDIVKHSVRTIAATLGKNDRLAIVTFSSDAKVKAEFTCMDETGKKNIDNVIEALRTEGMTNLWAGLKAGMNLFAKRSFTQPLAPGPGTSGRTEAGISRERLSALLLLTDGLPNVTPPRGHIPMLKHYLESCKDKNFTINTFGFGYQLDSKLLSEIADVGKGSFGFIPDAGMVGTVFVHAVANLYATYATCTLDIEIEGKVNVLGGLTSSEATWGVKIDVGDIQYGQTRDIAIQVPLLENVSRHAPGITVTARYRPWSLAQSDPDLTTILALSLNDATIVQNPNILYHIKRLEFVSTTNRVVTSTTLPNGQEFDTLLASIRQLLPIHQDALALGEDIEGQVKIAISSLEHYNRWGKHYLRSLSTAHRRQQCANFKDPGVQVYGRDSTLFTKSRDELDDAFDSLPLPTPSVRRVPSHIPHVYYAPQTALGNSPTGGPYASPPFIGFGSNSHSAAPPPPLSAPGGFGTRRRGAPTASAQMALSQPQQEAPTQRLQSMQQFRQQAAPCFAGDCAVKLADGTTTRIDQLRRGMEVMTGVGIGTVGVVVRTAIQGGQALMCCVGDLKVTPWHPIIDPTAKSEIQVPWAFPASITKPEWIKCDAVYSILLQQPSSNKINPDSHSIIISGVCCVTLGHGIVSGSDVRAHAFLGDYDAVLGSLSQLPGFGGFDGVVKSGGVAKSRVTGLVDAFIPPETKDDTRYRAKSNTITLIA